jgi:Carboxypeptidase regulatory-like domain
MTRSLRPVALWILVLSFVVAAPAKQKKEDPLATLNFVVIRDENGKPVRNAAVVMHPVDEGGKQIPNGLELKTSPEGKASYDGVPYGKLRVQVLAPGFQTYGEDYEIHEPSMDITIKLKRPAKQYSIYEDHPAENEQKNDPKKPQ